MSDSSSLFLGRFIAGIFGLLTVLMVIGIIRVVILTNSPPPPGAVDPAILEAEAEAAAAAEEAEAEAAADEAGTNDGQPPSPSSNTSEGEASSAGETVAGSATKEETPESPDGE